ncbi:MAG TPA: phosphomannomutase/phosphoglucomutase [Candidatus Saccharimonadales bacterium]|nr:phosphomannomutase/phosphoglucomutase [Candidatus Saccharimonadales bacterium]
MSELQDIFKAYDVRGKVGTELTADVAGRIGRAMAEWLPAEGAVAVGRDMRPDSEELANAAIKGLLAGGRDVVNIGQVTSDMIYFAVGDGHLAGGVMITASHNPGEYNGIKLCQEEAKPMALEGGLGEIRDLVIEDRFQDADEPGATSDKNIVDGWITHTLSFVDQAKLTPLKIAVDAGNGMAGAIFPALEKQVPWEVTELYFELDGTFPNHEANPLKFETLRDLIKTIRDNHLDAGIAFDGDGDRAFLIDETGEVVPGGAMSAMLAEYFLGKHPGSHVVYDARNSHTVPEVIEAAGGKPVLSRVGHSLIKQKMREKDAPFGGEASGHFYFRDNWYADSGLIAAVIGLYVATLSGKKLSELRQKYTHYAAIPETNFEVTDKAGAVARLKNEFKDREQDDLDGVSVFFEDGSWFNVRPSNTEPTLRLNAEAHDKMILDQLVQRVVGLIKG